MISSNAKPQGSFSWLRYNLHLAPRRRGRENSLRAIAIDLSSIPLPNPTTSSDNPFLPTRNEQRETSNALSLALIAPPTNDTLLLTSLPFTEFRCQSSDVQRFDSGNEQRVTSNAAQLCCAFLWDHKQDLLNLTDLVVADSAFSSRYFIDGLLLMGFNLISRFRNDEPLSYLYDGPPTGLRGRPKKYDGKIDFSNLDFAKAKPLVINPAQGKAFELQAWSNSLERSVKLVAHYLPNGSHRIYFSTDETLSGKDIYSLYHARLQFETSLRDTRNLNRSQPTDENASFSALNILKRRSQNSDFRFHPSVSNFKG